MLNNYKKNDRDSKLIKYVVCTVINSKVFLSYLCFSIGQFKSENE